jgi:hypothetical protein
MIPSSEVRKNSGMECQFFEKKDPPADKDAQKN